MKNHDRSKVVMVLQRSLKSERMVISDMDAHFNAYKAPYDILDHYVRQITSTQRISSIDIFINLDDILHTLHRPIVEKEFELCGLKAKNQCTSNIINIIGHYKRWATKLHIPSRVWMIYTSSRSFKNGIYVQDYRHYYGQSMDTASQQFYLMNDAIRVSLPIAKNICEYVQDVHMIDSGYLEPSAVACFLKNQGIANYQWSLYVSRDIYDLQYAYRDRWIFVSPKSDNTWVVNRAKLWNYICRREHIDPDTHNIAMYHHDVLPLALAVAGNKWRSIPRLGRIGWRTIFNYLDIITEHDSASGAIFGNRLLELLEKKKLPTDLIQNNLNVSSVETQARNFNAVDGSYLTSQLKYISDHEALTTINELYFQEFPINLTFLTASTKVEGPFAF